jgi:hypothetical protein
LIYADIPKEYRWITYFLEAPPVNAAFIGHGGASRKSRKGAASTTAAVMSSEALAVLATLIMNVGHAKSAAMPGIDIPRADRRARIYKVISTRI